jgi:hypothetical protein
MKKTQNGTKSIHLNEGIFKKDKNDLLRKGNFTKGLFSVSLISY